MFESSIVDQSLAGFDDSGVEDQLPPDDPGMFDEAAWEALLDPEPASRGVTLVRRQGRMPPP